MKHLAVAAVLGAASVYALPSFASPVVIQNSYVQAGVSDYGTLGSGGGTSPGILFDPTGTGNYGVNDFLTPGDPFEGFYIRANGGTVYERANNDGYSSFVTASPVSLTATSASWTSTSTDGVLSLSNTYTLTTVDGRSVIAVTSTLTALQALSGVLFERTLDPDPDVNVYGIYDTDNNVISNDQACGTGTQTGQTICIYSTSSYTHRAGVSADWTTDPADYLTGLNDGDGDYAIGLTLSLGDIAAGQSVTFDYGYALGASLEIVTGPTPTSAPEPASLALLGAGLAGLGFLRRRNGNA